MRLSSTAFTHSSTALFGLAVAGYAVLRLAGYDAPLPGHLALPAPILQLVPDPWQSDSQVAQLKGDLGVPRGGRPELPANSPAGTVTSIARPSDAPNASTAPTPDAQVPSGGTQPEETAPADGGTGDVATSDTPTVAPSDDSTDTTDSDDSIDSHH